MNMNGDSMECFQRGLGLQNLGISTGLLFDISKNIERFEMSSCVKPNAMRKMLHLYPFSFVPRPFPSTLAR